MQSVTTILVESVVSGARFGECLRKTAAGRAVLKTIKPKLFVLFLGFVLHRLGCAQRPKIAHKRRETSTKTMKNSKSQLTFRHATPARAAVGRIELFGTATAKPPTPPRGFTAEWRHRYGGFVFRKNAPNGFKAMTDKPMEVRKVYRDGSPRI